MKLLQFIGFDTFIFGETEHHSLEFCIVLFSPHFSEGRGVFRFVAVT